MNAQPISDMDGFDVIGDVHGCASHLVSLLHQMGYSNESGTYRHPRRQAVFVGDIIDRGPNQLGVINIVRAMANAGAAKVVMGNHEFNAIAHASPHPDLTDGHLREHSGKNRGQHR